MLYEVITDRRAETACPGHPADIIREGGRREGCEQPGFRSLHLVDPPLEVLSREQAAGAAADHYGEPCPVNMFENNAGVRECFSQCNSAESYNFV